jgi:hypothetical protein
MTTESPFEAIFNGLLQQNLPTAVIRPFVNSPLLLAANGSRPL